MKDIKKELSPRDTEKFTTSDLVVSICKLFNFKIARRTAVSIFGLTILILLSVTTNQAQFCNSASILIPDSGAANPYPSNISVSGLNGSVNTVAVTLNNIQHDNSIDLDILLVSPTGQKFIILSDIGGGTGFDTAATITLSDSATQSLPLNSTPIASGSYKPTNRETDSSFPIPAPAMPYANPAPLGSETFTSVFGNINPNGVWRLYVLDDQSNFSGSISGGWCLNFTTNAPASGQVQFYSSNFDGNEVAGAAQIMVSRTNGFSGAIAVDYATSGGTATGGATCSIGVDYISTIGTLTIPDGAESQTFPVTLCDDAEFDPDETVGLLLSNPTGGATLGSPTAATLTIKRLEQFCNSASISIPGLGAANPYPSDIMVAGLNGTINNITVSLNNIQHDRSGDVDILLVSPSGQKFIILSDVSGDRGFVTAANITLSDSATASLPSANIEIPSGTYKPTNIGVAADPFPAPAPDPPYSSPESATFASVFGNTNPNGVWSLYVVDDAFSNSGSISGGWCLNTATNQSAPGQFEFAAANYNIEEGYRSAEITVNRTNGFSGAVTVDYATSGGTAIGGAICSVGSDYISTNGSLSFSDGQLGSQTFTLKLCDDVIFEPAETVNLVLSNPTGGAISGSSAVLLIKDRRTPQKAIVSTFGSSDRGVVFNDPGNFPTVQNLVTGLPSDAKPHGVDYFGTDSALISDFGNSRIFVVRVSTAELLDTINTATAGYNGNGSIAVAPNGSSALAMSDAANQLYVIQAPFNASSTITSLTLPDSVAAYQTQAIVINSAGRAFVYHKSGISVLDAPYTTVSFTIPVSDNFQSGAIAITPDGNTILVTNLFADVRIFDAPFSAFSISTILPIPINLDGLSITPDGTKAIIVGAFQSIAYAISQPFDSSSTVETIFGSDNITPGFEDVGISRDGQLAILTGNSNGNEPAVLIKAPFTAANATSTLLPIQNVPNSGRGGGAVRFAPPAIAPGLLISNQAPEMIGMGMELTYTIRYNNTGAAAATNVIIRNPIPAGTSFVSATNGGMPVGNDVVFTLGTVNNAVENAVTAVQTVSFTVTVNTGAGGNVTNDNYTIEADGVTPVLGPPFISTVLGPTAASVTVSGRVLANNRGVSRVFVEMTDTYGSRRTAQTNPFGYYSFENIEVGGTYVFSVFSKQYTFDPRAVTVSEDLAGLDFIAQPQNKINQMR